MLPTQTLFIEFAPDISVGELNAIEQDINTRYKHAVKEVFFANVVR